MDWNADVMSNAMIEASIGQGWVQLGNQACGWSMAQAG
jgi:hypothetical protein